MDVDEAIRLGGRCSVWDCENPLMAEALCSTHLAFNCPPNAPGPESTVQRPLHKAKRTRRFALGRAPSRPAKNISLQTAGTPKQGDATLAHFSQLPTPPATHQLSSHRVSSLVPEHPAVPAPANTAPLRQNRATVQDVTTSAIAVENIPLRPREPYFVLNPDIPSIDKSHSESSRPQTARDLLESRYVPKGTSPGVNSALVDQLVQAGLEYASTLIMNAGELPSITVANVPSRKGSNPVDSRRGEALTMGVFQESGQQSQVIGNIPLHLSPKKRKADAADVQPRIREPAHFQKQEANSTSLAPERRTRSRSSAHPGDGTHTAPSGKPPKPQSPRLSDDQTTRHLRNSKRNRTSYDPMPVIDIAQAKVNGRHENLHNVQGDIPDGSGEHRSTPLSQEPQQPKPREIGSRDERESITVPPLSTPEKEVTGDDQTTPAARQGTAQEFSAATRRIFDSEAFDAMIYRQSSLRPPPGVPRESAAWPKTTAQTPSAGDQRRYLAVNPAIHMPHNRSDEWYKQKALEIQGRGGRKAWFGKVIERRRWIRRARERAEEEERNAAKASNKKPKRVDPQPWSYNRIMDFGDVPEEELPEDVLQNPAWVRACAWHRENETKRVLRDRAAKQAHMEAWNYAESIRNDARLVSEGSKGLSNQR